MYFPAFSMFDETGGSPNAAISPAVCWSSISCRVDAWSSEMDVASSGGNRCVAMVYCMTPNFKMNNTRWWQWHHISIVSWYLWISQHPSTSHLNQYFGGTSHILQRLLTPHGYYMHPRANFHYKTRGLESHTKRCGSYFLYEWEGWTL